MTVYCQGQEQVPSHQRSKLRAKVRALALPTLQYHTSTCSQNFQEKHIQQSRKEGWGKEREGGREKMVLI